MASIFRRFRRDTSKSPILSPTFSGDNYQKCRPSISIWNLSTPARSHGWGTLGSMIFTPKSHSLRYSSSAKLSKKPISSSVALSFIKSALDQPEGPNHCWFNNFETTKKSLKKNGTFLILSEQFSAFDNNPTSFENVKLLQQRFPELCVMGIQSDNLTSSAERSSLIQLILRENIRFPILLSNKTFYELSNGPCYVLFRDFKKPVFYPEKDSDFDVLSKAVEEIQTQQKGNLLPSTKLFSSYTKQNDILKEPNYGSLQNLLLNFPGCISADMGGDRLFVSDSNHHRIIVLNHGGKILDCIGSGPGFEDGEFESAKIMRPAGLFYNGVDDYLYIVDSENHAIRRADMESRVLETLNPASVTANKSRIWTWIMDKMGWESKIDTETKDTKELDAQTLMFPWHLIKSPGKNLLVIDRSFETLWTVNMDSGKIEETTKGFSNILAICGQQITEKISILKHFPHDWLRKQSMAVFSPKELPYGGLISSFTIVEDELIACDMVGQKIVKPSGEDVGSSNIPFSNFGVLGLPYWLQPHLEVAYKDTSRLVGTRIDHVQSFNLLPGRVDIQLNVDVPDGTELVEKMENSSIWRQARGVAVLASESEDVTGSPEKVGSAQNWYDELDNLAFLTPESESANEDNLETSDIKFKDDKVQISTTVNTSPGTSEVIISAVLYLKLRRESNSPVNDQEKYASRIADLLIPETSPNIERELFNQFLLQGNKDVRDLIFMRPLHVRIKLDSFDHPKAETSRDIILTESSITVNVSL